MSNRKSYRSQATGHKLRIVTRFFLVSCVLCLVSCLLGMASVPKKEVYVKVLKNKDYQLIVENRPYVVKGVCYNPVPIGKSHDYDFWVDPKEPWRIDGELMKKMGVNTVRFYQCGGNIEAVRKVISDLYNIYGIRTMMGSWLRFWSYPAPFYDDKDFRENVKKEVLEMVKVLKDEKGLLCWILGNENNFSFSGKINPWSSERIDKLGDARQCLLARAETYYTLINEITSEIHKIDPNHPVVMGNGELGCLDVASNFAKDVDILGCVIYRGKSFGNTFSSLRKTFDKPLLFIEFGCDAYNAYTKSEDEESQSKFLESQWSEIYRNLAGNLDGAGNCLGGVMFEWSDEWWKHNDWDASAWAVHDAESNWSNGSYYYDIKAERNMNMNEEWFGLVRLEKGEGDNLDKRVLRKGYYMIREFWKKPYEVKKKSP